MEKTDEQIMLEFQTGNTEVVEMIYTRYKSQILNFSLRMLGNRAQAEDVTGEVFLALFSKKYVFHPEAKFSTWLYTVTRNSCISQMRRSKGVFSLFQSNEGEGEWDIPDTSHDSREDALRKERTKLVRLSIKKLPAEQREALILREYHKKSYDEISQIIDCSLEKVKILIFRARDQLRNNLASYIKEAN